MSSHTQTTIGNPLSVSEQLFGRAVKALEGLANCVPPASYALGLFMLSLLLVICCVDVMS